jgi:GT2 family glycosyltransferase
MFDEDPADVDPDMSMSGRCDEEGILLRLKAAGHEMRVAYDAVVVHEHYYTGRAFFKQAYKGGQAAARLVYQYRLPPRLDLTPLFFCYITLPLAWFGAYWALIPAACSLFFLTAITYNDLFRRRKTVSETLITFPVQLAYYHLRLVGYLIQRLRLLIGRDRIKRVNLARR